MPKENKAAFIILGLLNHEDLSGYDIKKQIDMGISRFWEYALNSRQYWPNSIIRKKHLGNQEMMRFFKGNLEKVLDEDKDHLYYYLTVLFGEKMYDAYVSWAKEAKTILEKYKEDNSEN